MMNQERRASAPAPQSDIQGAPPPLPSISMVPDAGRLPQLNVIPIPSAAGGGGQAGTPSTGTPLLPPHSVTQQPQHGFGHPAGSAHHAHRHFSASGLSTTVANRRVVDSIESLIREFEAKNTRIPWSVRWSFFLTFDGLVITACVLILLGLYCTAPKSLLIVEVLLLLPFIAANVWINYRAQRIEQIRALAKVKESLETFIGTEGAFSSMISNDFSFSDPPSSSMVSVLRDNEWRRMPYNMVVEGDVFKLRAGEFFPTDAILLEAKHRHPNTSPHAHPHSSAATPPPFPSAARAQQAAQATHHATDIVLTPSSLRYESGRRFLPTSLSSQHPTPSSTKSVIHLHPHPHPHSRACGDNVDNTSPTEDPSVFGISVASPAHREHHHGGGGGEGRGASMQVPPSLVQASFLATSTACLQQVRTFLETSLKIKSSLTRARSPFDSLQSGGEDSSGTRQPSATTFFEIAFLVRRKLMWIWGAAMIITVASTVFWEVWSGLKDQVVPSQMRRDRWLLPVRLSLCFMPLVHRILLQITDVWGNARLQSLFQWIREDQVHRQQPANHQLGVRTTSTSKKLQWRTSSLYGAVTKALDSVPGARSVKWAAANVRGRVWRWWLRAGTRVVPNATLTGLRSQASSAAVSEDDESEASSSSQFSASNVPLSKQFRELLDILRHGLDGASNLLHTLNSTTVLCFCDKEGLLTDTCRTIQEICICATPSATVRHSLSAPQISSAAPPIPARDITSAMAIGNDYPPSLLGTPSLSHVHAPALLELTIPPDPSVSPSRREPSPSVIAQRSASDECFVHPPYSSHASPATTTNEHHAAAAAAAGSPTQMSSMSAAHLKGLPAVNGGGVGVGVNMGPLSGHTGAATTSPVGVTGASTPRGTDVLHVPALPEGIGGIRPVVGEKVVLDIQVDSLSSEGLRFEEMTWRTHLATLTPLALAMNLWKNLISQPSKSTAGVFLHSVCCSDIFRGDTRSTAPCFVEGASFAPLPLPVPDRPDRTTTTMTMTPHSLPQPHLPHSASNPSLTNPPTQPQPPQTQAAKALQRAYWVKVESSSGSMDMDCLREETEQVVPSAADTAGAGAGVGVGAVPGVSSSSPAADGQGRLRRRPWRVAGGRGGGVHKCGVGGLGYSGGEGGEGASVSIHPATDVLQDCLCPVSRLIGVPEKAVQAFRPLSFVLAVESYPLPSEDLPSAHQAPPNPQISPPLHHPIDINPPVPVSFPSPSPLPSPLPEQCVSPTAAAAAAAAAAETQPSMLRSISAKHTIDDSPLIRTSLDAWESATEKDDEIEEEERGDEVADAAEPEERRDERERERERDVSGSSGGGAGGQKGSEEGIPSGKSGAVYWVDQPTCIWLVQDPRDGSLQLFCKSRPRVLLDRCRHYFDGDSIQPLCEETKQSLRQLLVQWKSSGLDGVAFGYRPLTHGQQIELLRALHEQNIFAVEMHPNPVTLPHAHAHPAHFADPSPSVTAPLLTYSPIAAAHTTPDLAAPPPVAQESPYTSVWYAAECFPGAKDALAITRMGALGRLGRGGHQQHQHHPQQHQHGPALAPPRTPHSLRKSPSNADFVSPDRQSANTGAFQHHQPDNWGEGGKGDLCTAAPSYVNTSLTMSPVGFVGGGGVVAGGAQPVMALYGAGQMLKALLHEQIFLGMAALRMQTSREVSSLIQDFHQAGIRFVYFSREGEKRTRITGGQLGLETGWNCMISLTRTFGERKNQDGKVILPSGIEDIRRHVLETDNVPLLMSLFCNGNAENIQQMIGILQEHGEVVTCIGSALRPSNFGLFGQANCSVSVLVGPHPICRSCHGKRWVGPLHQHVLPRIPSEYVLSASLTSLPCALQSHHTYIGGETHLILELLLNAFKEARRCVDSIQQAIVFYVGGAALLSCILLLQSLLGLPGILHGVQLMVILLIYLPLLSTCLLANPATEMIMQEFPLKAVDQKAHAKTNVLILHYCLRFCPSALAVAALFLLFLHQNFHRSVKGITVDTIDKQAIVHPLVSLTNNDGRVDEALGVVGALCEGFQWHHWLTGEWGGCYAALEELGELIRDIAVSVPAALAVDLEEWLEYWPPIQLHLAQLFAALATTLFITLLALSFVDRFESLLKRGPFRNVPLVVTASVLLVVQVAASLIVLAVQHTSATKRSQGPSWVLWVVFACWPAVVLAIDETIKTVDRRQHQKLQKYLRIVFNTRLGMWSPK
ncbi:unnamed protein product [Vitrella brassicaformis CCMP3155]|uniref:Cation-transporting P-type ATPase N-terminal domain-containing protein n=4 Tax=Vitrella brassicaformis TaxID=1169539 RepID=A0A0G4GZL8_VITBC|nr:unnamed protein product [Vitrella brassicaformis CCMP3155]|eukprot:CEM36670.1 unnamed protein product [Vitrella brassicaformis CCMP3155]